MSKKTVIPMEFKRIFIIFVASATLFGGSLLYNLGLIISSAHSARIIQSGNQGITEVSGNTLSEGTTAASSVSIEEDTLTNIFSPDKGMDIPTKWNKTELGNVATGDFSDLFKLSGTIYSNKKSWRRAYFLLNSTKKIKGYREGETVTGNIRVVAVRRNSVVLNAGGDLREVKIKPTDLEAARSPARANISQPSIGDKGDSFKVARLSESAFAVDKDSVDYLIENINKMITKVRIIPYFESGQAAGFRLAAIRPGSTFSKLGFLPGDIIKQVNGILLTSPEKIYTIFQNLRDERKIEINILRRGVKKTITYEVR